MDFFEHQEGARRKTRYLIFLFVAAVVAIVLAVDLVVAFVVANAGRTSGGFLVPDFAWAFDHAGVMALSTFGTAGLIGATSLYRLASLRAGGGSVARGMGGQAVTPDTQDPLRRRLYNVVEEMAIASGVPVPEVYVLDNEPGINAFAAGFSAGDAAVAVTRGTLERLSREELQGVVAHEFSHVLNGDMRLNIKLMGILFGILVLGLIGRTILRSARYSGRRSSRRNGGSGAVLAVGLALFVIGYVGVFFGRLIKAGVSRQREFLADASAVQFTRQTEGIAGALKKIAGFMPGSVVESPRAEEISHMLFALGSRSLSSLMATHPPIEARIRALDPHFDPAELDRIAEVMNAEPAIAPPEAPGVAAFSGAVADDRPIAISPEAVVSMVANPAVAHVQYAARLTRAIPPLLVEAAHSAQGSVSLICALLLDSKPEVRQSQLAKLRQHMGSAFAEAVDSLYPALTELGARFRLPLVELAFPALKRRPLGQIEAIENLIQRIIEADGRIDVFEYVLAKVLRSYLEDAKQPIQDRPRRPVPTRKELSKAVQSLFAVLAGLGHETADSAQSAYRSGMEALLGQRAAALPFITPEVWTTALDEALETLNRMRFRVKQKLVRALVATVSHDGKVTVVEAELLRGICAAFRVPIPPLLANP